MGKRLVKCQWSNSGFICKWHTKCPREDDLWMERVNRWALTGRSPRSASLDPVPGSHRPDSQDGQKADQCSLSVLFRDYEAVLEWCNNERDLTLAICEDLFRGRYIWRRLQKGIEKDNRHKAGKTWDSISPYR